MKKIVALLGALIVALGLTLVAAPAQAYGWTAQRCTVRSGNGAKICAAVHTSPRGNGLRVDQIQLCNYKLDNTYGNHFRGTKNNALDLRGSAGNLLGSTGLPAVSASYAGVCGYVNVALDGGNGSCYTLRGDQDLAQFIDESYSVSGAALGGAC